MDIPLSQMQYSIYIIKQNPRQLKIAEAMNNAVNCSDIF